jgi:hypothetical protein
MAAEVATDTTHHHQGITTTPRPRRQPVVHGCRVNPSSTAGDHVRDRRSLQGSPCRQGALTNGPTVVSAASSLPSGWGSGRGARSRRRPPAWRLGASGGRRMPGIRGRPIGGSRRPDAQPRPTSASQYRQYSRIPHAPSGLPATLAMNPDLAGLLVIPKADSPPQATRGSGGAEELTSDPLHAIGARVVHNTAEDLTFQTTAQARDAAEGWGVRRVRLRVA